MNSWSEFAPEDNMDFLALAIVIDAAM